MEEKNFNQKKISEKLREIIAEVTMSYEENEVALASGNYVDYSCKCIRHESCCGCIIQ